MNKRLNIKYVDKLSGRQFEFYCGWLFRRFLSKSTLRKVKITKATNDHGADVLLYDHVHSNPSLAFQCKHLSDPNQRTINYRALEETAAGKEYYHAQGASLITNGLLSSRIKKDANHMGISIMNRYSIKYMINKIIKRTPKETQIPGYSTVRIAKNDVVDLKAVQEVLGFKNRSDVVRDMIDSLKDVYLNTPKKRNAYRGIRRSIIEILRIKGQIK